MQDYSTISSYSLNTEMMPLLYKQCTAVTCLVQQGHEFEHSARRVEKEDNETKDETVNTN